MNETAYFGRLLYLIEFLHQTTTALFAVRLAAPLYLIEFLHQTTTPLLVEFLLERCILLNFYIKPQLKKKNLVNKTVVSY